MKKFISIVCAIVLICTLSVTGFAAHYVGGSCAGYATNGRVSMVVPYAYAKTYCEQSGAYKEITNFQGQLRPDGGVTPRPFGPMGKVSQYSGKELSQQSSIAGFKAERLSATHKVQSGGKTWVGGTY